jgi:DNA-binding Xre family transcriptional regulator
MTKRINISEIILDRQWKHKELTQENKEYD